MNFCVNETLKHDPSKESYWAVLSSGRTLSMLYKVVLTFVSGNEIPKCHFSSESY